MVVSSGGGGAYPGIAGGFRNVLDFFRRRVDIALEDADEAAVAAVTARGGPSNEVAATWAVDVSLFLRAPTSPLSSKAARGLERVALTLECSFAPKDPGVYPSRGAAGVRDSRFFADVDSEAMDGTPGVFWIADEPGYFKFTLKATAPVVASGVEVLPVGDVYFNAKIDRGAGGGGGGGGREEGAEAESANGRGEVRLTSGVVTVKRDVPASFMGANYDGILAEYIVVGTFTAARRN